MRSPYLLYRSYFFIIRCSRQRPRTFIIGWISGLLDHHLLTIRLFRKNFLLYHFAANFFQHFIDSLFNRLWISRSGNA
jgi:hypothetical protein